MTAALTEMTEAPPLLGWHWELEITGKCQLVCQHCCTDSGPDVGHGTMSTSEWLTLITDAKALGSRSVQLIGGEPTMHPDFAELLAHAIDAGLDVEVYSNLVNVRDEWWELLSSPRVNLATSYYSDDPAQHATVTGRRASHARTRANIAEALKRGIPLRAGIVDIFNGQRVDQARAELEAMGVTSIGTDRVRGIGRAAATIPDVSQLCGQCGRGKASISPDGNVRPCLMARWMTAGNVLESSLVDIVNSSTWRRLVSTIPSPRADGTRCKPDANTCKPTQGDGSDCAPASRPACNPRFCSPELNPSPKRPGSR
ncbi:radical SAM protein [Streptosporangium canum]|uniref:radical SAM/SPASM domain-containing protein n=1 Tax=Streptosporangium canum TaxID=324952 RepID=UPI003431EC60